MDVILQLFNVCFAVKKIISDISFRFIALIYESYCYCKIVQHLNLLHLYMFYFIATFTDFLKAKQVHMCATYLLEIDFSVEEKLANRKGLV